MRRAAWIIAPIASLTIVLAGCGHSDEADTSNPRGQSASYRGEVTPAASGSTRADQVEIGVGENNHYPAPWRTIAAGHQVDAECQGEAGRPPRIVVVTTAEGWKIQLTHGSQTIVAENPQIEAPPGTITTDQFSIDEDLKENAEDLEQTGTASVYTAGVNWDKPSPGHIEIQMYNETPPPEWGESPGFSMYMHINCGGDPAALPSSTTTRSPS